MDACVRHPVGGNISTVRLPMAAADAPNPFIDLTGEDSDDVPIMSLPHQGTSSC